MPWLAVTAAVGALEEARESAKNKENEYHENKVEASRKYKKPEPQENTVQYWREYIEKAKMVFGLFVVCGFIYTLYHILSPGFNG